MLSISASLVAQTDSTCPTALPLVNLAPMTVSPATIKGTVSLATSPTTRGLSLRRIDASVFQDCSTVAFRLACSVPSAVSYANLPYCACPAQLDILCVLTIPAEIVALAVTSLTQPR
jgi:hypothetical protein